MPPWPPARVVSSSCHPAARSTASAVGQPTERSAVEPKSPYGRHKLEAETLVARSGIPFAIARPSNIYGPRQAMGLEGAVVAAFVTQARAGERMTIDGDGNQTRDFIHARDVVEALIRLARPSIAAGIWNVSAGSRTSIGELAALVEREAGVALGRTHRPSRAGDVHDSAISSAKLRTTGWKPAISLASGIRELLRDARAKAPSAVQREDMRA